MKAILLLFTCVPMFAFSQATFELLDHFTLEEIEDIVDDFNPPGSVVKTNYEVDYYKVTYKTLHPNGDSVLVTGAFAIPTQTGCPMPLISYLHGTVFEKTDVPSNLNYEGTLGIIFASAGYVMAMPDYVGLGESPGLHLYMHGDTEAQSAIDLFRVARSNGDELGFTLNDQLFLLGYSQGGHSCMATHKKIQEELSDEFEVTHSAPMSGPYDMSGAQSAPILADQPYSVPGYIPYLMLSYQEVYGNLFSTLEEAFQPDVAMLIQDYLDGSITLSQANAILPSLPSEMFSTTYFEAVQTNPNHPLLEALRDNDLYDWIPESSLTMYACTQDEQVFFENASITYDAMIENGAQDVDLVNLGPFTHSGCAPFALFFGYAEIESFRESSNLGILGVDVVNATTGNGMDGSASITLENAPASYEVVWSTEATGDMVGGLSQGNYSVSVIDEQGCVVSQTFEVDEVMSVTEVAGANWTLRVMDDVLLLEGCKAGETFDLYTLDGKQIASRQSRGNTLRVSTQLLPHGVYLVRSRRSGASQQFVR